VTHGVIQESRSFSTSLCVITRVLIESNSEIGRTKKMGCGKTVDKRRKSVWFQTKPKDDLM
jgi:hypothetical protein